MDLDKFVKYCLFIEETGRELEQRALNGQQMPEVLRSRAPGVYRQSKLGIRRVFEPAGKFGPTPDIPAVFPLRTVAVEGGRRLSVPEVGAVRLVLTQFGTGMRTTELLRGMRHDVREPSVPGSITLTWPQPRSTRTGCHIVPPQSLGSRMLEQEMEVQRRVGKQPRWAFEHLDDRGPFTETEVSRVKSLLWGTFLFEFGYSLGTARPNPRGDSFNALRQQLGHRALDLTRYYPTAGLHPVPNPSNRPTDRRTGR